MNIKSFEHHEIIISSNCCTFCIVSIYRPPNLSLLTFLQEFKDYIETVCSYLDKSCQLFCIGDYNINLLHYDINQQITSFIQLMYSHLLYPTILRPTRVTHKSATLIDNIFTNVPNLEFSAQIISDISDHFPILSSFSVSTSYKTPSSNSVANYKLDVNASNLRHFESSLSKSSWDFITESSLVEDDFNRFIYIVSSNAVNCFPRVAVKKKVSTLLKPWMSPGL